MAMGRLLFFDSRTGVLLTEGYFAFKRHFYLFASDFFFFFLPTHFLLQDSVSEVSMPFIKLAFVINDLIS